MAQQPSTQQVQQALQNQPVLAEQARQRLMQSGLTPGQVRARLRAAGYPDSLLDAYLTGAPSSSTSEIGAEQFAAIRALGLDTLATIRERIPLDTGLIRPGFRERSRVFGVDVFRRTTTQFLPVLSGPVPPDYHLGPGDNLVLILTGDVELAYPLSVTREGFVLIPNVGQVFVSNLTLDQLRDVLFVRLGKVYSGVRRGPNATTRFDITVANVRVVQVYVVGEVGQPGAYQLSALGTVLSALYAAGGVTERANSREIALQRGSHILAQFDLYDYVLRGDTRNDIRLETGDVIFVPVQGIRAEIGGAVVRPAIYELKPEESLADLVSAAGGFRSNAALRRVAVHRILPANQLRPGPFPRAVIDVPLLTRAGTDGVTAGSHARDSDLVPPIPLINGDSVVVDSVSSLGADAIYVGIVGMVSKPDRYPWQPGMTLRDLVRLARGPSVGALLSEAEIARLPTDRSAGQLATTLRVPLDSSYLYERDSLGRYIGAPGDAFPASGAPEVPLQPFDNVLILRQPNFEFQRTVGIFGEVRFPGTYSLRSKDDRLADLIDRAGALTPRAYPQGVQFYRTGKKVGRIDIDLPHALSDRRASDNVILQPGDSVVIPEYQPSVKVLGAFNSPGAVLWKAGQNLDYYISAAGGYAFNADRDKTSVRYADGRVRTKHGKLLFFSDSPKPGPGSEVFVPLKDPNEKALDLVVLFGTLAQILSSTVAIVLV
ncbi:MAG: SLBB domain-containing protein, partial [Gemmatimonadetes bacterium]|nr:SLBB domain-containing protein [Gemmatimonadota bacterium]